MADENNKIKLLLLWDILSNIKNNGLKIVFHKKICYND